MRFTVISSITLLAATLASGLVIPATSESGALVSRSQFGDDGIENIIERRSPRTTAAKKARILAAAPAKAAAKAAHKAASNAKYAKAAKAHRATTNLPARKSTFRVAAQKSRDANGQLVRDANGKLVDHPGGKPQQTWTGKEVRKAVFQGHVEAQRLKGLNRKQLQKLQPPPTNQQFKNYAHRLPKHPSQPHPIKGMTVNNTPGKMPGRESPLPNHAAPGTAGPGRVIVQQTKNGRYTFKGVIAHDQSRLKGTDPKTNGYNDHFKLKEFKRRT